MAAQRAVTHRILAARIGPLRGVGLWGSLGVIALFLIVSIPQYAQPFVIDEAVFPYVADGILKNGAPYFYNGEERPNDLGLWHPPLYDYLLAGQLWLWGVSTSAVRALGAICVIGSFFILTLALKRIAPDLRQYGYVIMAGLFLLNPLVISDALVPDIDGTVGVVLVALAIWLATVVAQELLSRRMLVMLFTFATLAVSTKFIIAFIVIAIIGGGALISPVQRLWKVLWIITTFITGAALSLGMLFALGFLLRFNAIDPFNYLFGSLGARAPGRSGIEGAINNLMFGPGSNVVWIGPAIIISAFAVLAVILVRKPQSVSRSAAALLVAMSALIVLGYSYITASPFNFPKYTAIAVPGLAIVVTLIVTQVTSMQRSRIERPKPVVWALSAAYACVLVGGTAGIFVLTSRHEHVHGRDLNELFLLSVGVFLGVVIATVTLAYLLAPSGGGGHRSRIKWLLQTGAIAALVFTPLMMQTSSSLVNLTSPYATRYYYGERGMTEFLASVGEVVPRGAMMIAPKDVGLQLGRPFYEDAQLLLQPASDLRSDLEKIRAPYLVTRDLWDYSEIVFPEHFDVFRDYYEPVIDEGKSDFVLWKLK